MREVGNEMLLQLWARALTSLHRALF